MIAMIDVDPKNPDRRSLRRWGIRTVRTRSAASSARPTAARRSRRCSTRTNTPARTTFASTRTIRTRSMRCCGSSRSRSEGGAFGGASGGDLQVDRWRHDVEAADRRASARALQANLGSRLATRERFTRSVAPAATPNPSAPAAGAADAARRRREWRRRDGVVQVDRWRRSLGPRVTILAAEPVDSRIRRTIARSGGSAAAICRRSPSILRTPT